MLISGTSDSLRGLSEFTSSHPLCTTPIIVGKAALDSLEDVRQDTRVVLTCADGFVPASLCGPDGFFAKLLTLLNSFETRDAGEIPLMLATGKTHDWDIPMGGATERKSVDFCAGLGNDEASCVADDGCQWLGTSGNAFPHPGGLRITSLKWQSLSYPTIWMKRVDSKREFLERQISHQNLVDS